MRLPGAQFSHPTKIRSIRCECAEHCSARLLISVIIRNPGKITEIVLSTTNDVITLSVCSAKKLIEALSEVSELS